jgi:hypothetical protein
MKLGVHTFTKNRRFPKALRRIHNKINDLKALLAPIALTDRFGNVMLTFIDEEPSVIRVTKRGKADDVYEVDVGYDFAHNYPPEDDVLVVQLIEEKLKQLVEGDAGFAPWREELLRVITDWTTEAIGA